MDPRHASIERMTTERAAVERLVVQHRIQRMSRRVGWVAAGLGILILAMLLLQLFRLNP